MQFGEHIGLSWSGRQGGGGEALKAYQYKLADSESLAYLAQARKDRVLTGVQTLLEPDSEHSAYVLREGCVTAVWFR